MNHDFIFHIQGSSLRLVKNHAINHSPIDLEVLLDYLHQPQKYKQGELIPLFNCSCGMFEYKIPAFDGALTNGNLTSRLYKKTIYDPTIWTDVKLKKALMEAMADKMRSAEGIVEGPINQGRTIEGYYVDFRYREEQVKTFYFGIEEIL